MMMGLRVPEAHIALRGSFYELVLEEAPVTVLETTQILNASHAADLLRLLCMDVLLVADNRTPTSLKSVEERLWAEPLRTNGNLAKLANEVSCPEEFWIDPHLQWMARSASEYVPLSKVVRAIQSQLTGVAIAEIVCAARVLMPSGKYVEECNANLCGRVSDLHNLTTRIAWLAKS